MPRKILVILYLFIGFSGCTRAQKTDPTAEVYKKIETLPDFAITAVPDSTTFSSRELKKNVPVIVMFFSPDCDHCQKETKELLAWKTELKDIQIVMLSSSPYNKVKEFYNEYTIATMSNIKMGTDPDYKTGLLYRPRTYPAMYIYNSSHTLAKTYTGNAGVKAILDALK